MVKDISRQTIMMLVVLTVVFSVLGTLTVMSETNKAITGAEQADSTTEGHVRLNIVSGIPSESASDGQIRLEITNN